MQELSKQKTGTLTKRMNKLYMHVCLLQYAVAYTSHTFCMFQMTDSLITIRIYLLFFVFNTSESILLLSVIGTHALWLSFALGANWGRRANDVL